jgi:hypothetical protein
MMNLDHKSMIKYEKSNILSIGDFSGGPLDSGPVPHPTDLIQPYQACAQRTQHDGYLADGGMGNKMVTKRKQKGKDLVETW